MISTIKTAAVSGMWKAGAIAALVALISSSAYLGYQWHSAAAARDSAVDERTKAEQARDQALKDVGELRAHVTSQNASIQRLAATSALAGERYAAAMQAFGPIKTAMQALAGRVAAQQSTTCEQALAKQRQAIEGLRGMQP